MCCWKVAIKELISDAAEELTNLVVTAALNLSEVAAFNQDAALPPYIKSLAGVVSSASCTSPYKK